MEDALLIHFEQIVIFSTQIQTNSSYFVKSYNISSLNKANYTERLLFVLLLVDNFSRTQKYFAQIRILTFVTNFDLHVRVFTLKGIVFSPSRRVNICDNCKMHFLKDFNSWSGFVGIPA